MITKIGKAFAVIGALALLAMPAHALAQEGEPHHEGEVRHEHETHHEGEVRHEHETHHEGEVRHESESHHEANQLQGKGAMNDQWYQGQQGHWYQEGNRWHWRPYGGSANYNKGYQAHQHLSPAQLQRREGLVNQDRKDRELYRAALRRGDKKAAEHYLQQLNSTDKMLGMTQQQINAGMRPYADGHIGK